MVCAMMSLNLHDLERGQDRVQGAPRVVPGGPVSVVDHLLEAGQRKILVAVGGFLCVVPQTNNFGFSDVGFTMN
jgi:hypothetical protein